MAEKRARREYSYVDHLELAEACPNCEGIPVRRLETHILEQEDTTARGHQRLLICLLDGGKIICVHRGYQRGYHSLASTACAKFLPAATDLPGHAVRAGDTQQKRTRKGLLGCWRKFRHLDGSCCRHYVVEGEDGDEAMTVKCAHASRY